MLLLCVYICDLAISGVIPGEAQRKIFFAKQERKIFLVKQGTANSGMFRIA
jgi:hypothetical protein